jgi:hypothetical protein
MATGRICLQDEDGQILEGHSISAGLDYPGIGPEHAWLHDIGRAQYVSITDTEALEAFQLSLRDRGHHSRARAVTRAGPCREDRAGSAVRPPDRDEHVRSWRQGHLHRRPRAGLGHGPATEATRPPLVYACWASRLWRRALNPVRMSFPEADAAASRPRRRADSRCGRVSATKGDHTMKHAQDCFPPP